MEAAFSVQTQARPRPVKHWTHRLYWYVVSFVDYVDIKQPQNRARYLKRIRPWRVERGWDPENSRWTYGRLYAIRYKKRAEAEAALASLRIWHFGRYENARVMKLPLWKRLDRRGTWDFLRST